MAAALQIHRVRGRDLRDALERAGRLHGTRALVLGHEELPGGGVTVAVGERSSEAEEEALQATRFTPRPVSNALERGLADVERALRRSGASGELVERVCSGVRRTGATGMHALEAAAGALETFASIAPSPRLARGQAAGSRAAARWVLAVAGPTGVGKTTTLVKLAARLVGAGRRVALITLDARRPGAVEQLDHYARLLQVPLAAAHDGPGLAAAVGEARARDVVLVDTSGRSPQDRAALEELAASLQDARAAGGDTALEVYLALCATASAAALEEAQLAFDPLRPAAMVITKLDETRRPAAVLEHAARSGLPVAFLTDGQEVSAHLHRPKPEHWADLLLRGRLV